MKCFFVAIVFLCLTTPVYAQTDTATFRIDSLPPTGILLDKGWLWRAGDNPDWAKPALNDSTWTPINPMLPLHQLPQVMSAGLGWMRFRFRLDNHLRQRMLLLRVSQFVASEVYLNGRLIQRYGTVSARPGQVRAYGFNMDPVAIRPNGQPEQVLAIRLAYWPWLAHFNDEFQPYLIQLHLGGLPEFIRLRAELTSTQITYYVLFSIFLLLALLHFAFYRFNPAQRANRYFMRYSLAEAAGILCQCFALQEHDIARNDLLFFGTFGLCIMGTLWVIQALYSLFNYRVSAGYYSLWGVYVVCLFLYVLMPWGLWPIVG